VADKKHNAGFYANVIFTGTPTIITQLRTKLALNEEVFRVFFTSAPEPKPAK
jgi:ribosomal protein S6